MDGYPELIDSFKSAENTLDEVERVKQIRKAITTELDKIDYKRRELLLKSILLQYFKIEDLLVFLNELINSIKNSLVDLQLEENNTSLPLKIQRNCKDIIKSLLYVL